jgi:UDPglucose 6-dehydrogenase
MQVTVIGTGYVGLVTGTCLAELGNEVVCLDIAADRIRRLNAGEIPIYEPGLDDLIRRNRADGRLSFTGDVAHAIGHGDIIFIAVGTPPQRDGGADLTCVLAAARDIGRHMCSDKVVVNKSTVPVGTAEGVHEVIENELAIRGIRVHDGVQMFRGSELKLAVASNPEFLKEGAAVEDFMRPDRIVLGVSSDATGEWALGLMRNLYAPLNRHHQRILAMSQRAAELTKYAANAMLATRISFMNELANLAEHLGVDVESVRHGIGSDPRIGYSFLYAGAGYGGSCFPKDLRALQHSAVSQGVDLQLLRAVEVVNRRQKMRLLQKVLQRFGENLSNRCFGIWGLAFKPETDDMREAPSRVLIEGLLRRGAHVRAHDPAALETARAALREDLGDAPELWDRISFHADAHAVLPGADALIIMTEWKAFRSPNLAHLRTQLRQALVFDGRNLYDPAYMAQQGFEYQGIGRVASAEARLWAEPVPAHRGGSGKSQHARFGTDLDYGVPLEAGLDMQSS